MKLLLDENGNAVLKDGMPVYKHEDGREAPLDATALVRRLENLSEEKDRHFKTADELKKKLEKFGEVTPEDALNAINTMKGLDDKKLIDAGEANKIREELAAVYTQKERDLIDTHTKAINDANAKVETMTRKLHDQHLFQEFSRSPYFTGNDPKTNLPPEIAVLTFRDFFDIREVDGKLTAIGVLDGKDIPSREKFGNPAPFNEAMGVILESHPLRDKILASKAGGPGNQPGKFNSGDKNVILSKADAKDRMKWLAAKEQATKLNVPLIIEE